MQAGLMNTYQHPASNRSGIAWALSAVLLVAYILLYFGPIPALGLRVDLLQRLAEGMGAALGLPDFLRSKWFVYGTLYTVAMIAGGLFVLRRHGNSPYQRIRTYSVVGVQVAMAFLLPSVLQVFGQREYYFSYFWPLKIEYFYPAVILKQPLMANQSFKRAACVGCGMCAHVCPRGVLKLETKPDRFKGGTPIRVFAVDL